MKDPMKPKPSTAARAAAASLALGAVLAAATPARAGGTLDADFNFATLVGPERLQSAGLDSVRPLPAPPRRHPKGSAFRSREHEGVRLGRRELR